MKKLSLSLLLLSSVSYICADKLLSTNYALSQSPCETGSLMIQVSKTFQPDDKDFVEYTKTSERAFTFAKARDLAIKHGNNKNSLDILVCAVENGAPIDENHAVAYLNLFERNVALSDKSFDVFKMSAGAFSGILSVAFIGEERANSLVNSLKSLLRIGATAATEEADTKTVAEAVLEAGADTKTVAEVVLEAGADNPASVTTKDVVEAKRFLREVNYVRAAVAVTTTAVVWSALRYIQNHRVTAVPSDVFNYIVCQIDWSDDAANTVRAKLRSIMHRNKSKRAFVESLQEIDSVIALLPTI